VVTEEDQQEAQWKRNNKGLSRVSKWVFLRERQRAPQLETICSVPTLQVTVPREKKGRKIRKRFHAPNLKQT
jgi:hypothetical protein